MSYSPKFYGIKKGNKFIFDDREQYDLYIDHFKEDTPMEMTVKRKYKKRTAGLPGEETNFNGYLWGVILKMIADEVGEFDLDKVYCWAQIAVGNFVAMRDGTKVPKGTSEMSGGEFAEFCQRIREWANQPGEICELGMRIPAPNEVEWE